MSIGRRACVAVDMQSYGARPGRRQAEAQSELVAVLDAAAATVGLDRQAWAVQRSGDGEFAVLPAEQSEAVLIDDFVRVLDTRLRDLNETRQHQWRIRLRLAADFGPVQPAPNGFAGDAPVTVGRLLDSAVVRRALARHQSAQLAVILSGRIFDDVVAAGHTVLRPADFVPVRVRVKEYDAAAWLRVPGVPVEHFRDDRGVHGDDEPPIDASRSPRDDQRTSAAPTGDRPVGDPGAAARDRPTYVNNQHFQDTVDVHGGVVGMNFGAAPEGGRHG